MDPVENKQPHQELQTTDSQAPQATSQEMPSVEVTKNSFGRLKERFSKDKKKIYVGLAVVLGFLVLSLTLLLLLRKGTGKDKVSKVTPKGGSLLTTGSLAGEIPRFAEFSEEMTTITPSIPGYTLSGSELSITYRK